MGIVFDATSAGAHRHNDEVLRAYPVTVVDLTPAAITGELRTYLHSNGLAHAEVTPVRPGIEDAFMALMGTPEAVG